MANEIKGLVNLTTGAEIANADAQYARQGIPGAPVAETLYGVKTFSSFPLTPSSAPVNNYDVANKLYVDNNIGAANAMVYKDVIDCSTNPNYPAASIGWMWIVSVAGKIGGVSGEAVDVGDMILCRTASAGGVEIAEGAKFNVIEHNISGMIIGPSSSTADAIAIFDSTTGKLIKDSTITLTSLVNTTQATGQTIGTTGSRLTKLWVTDITCTNVIVASISGTAALATNMSGGNGTTLVGALPYQSATNTTTLLAPNVTTTKKFLRGTGDGTNGTAPVWDTIALADVPTYIVSLSAVPTPTTTRVAGAVGYYLGYKYTWVAASQVVREVVETTW
jgi:hypothetical protein